MRHRHAISDESWQRIKDLLPGRPGVRGRTAFDNRRFVDAVLWIGKTGAPWRDLPERFGNWNNVFTASTVGPREASGRRSSRRYKIPTWSGSSSTPRSSVPIPTPQGRKKA